LHTALRYTRRALRLGASYIHYWYAIPTITDSITAPPSNIAGSGTNNIFTFSSRPGYDAIPEQGRTATTSSPSSRRAASGDTKWRDGRVFSLVYHAGEAHAAARSARTRLYASTNLLNPMAFASLQADGARDRRDDAAGLSHGPASAVGTVTSGGTESSCARSPPIAIVRARGGRGTGGQSSSLPTTFHPAFDKAAHYFGVKLVQSAGRAPTCAPTCARWPKAITWRTIRPGRLGAAIRARRRRTDRRARRASRQKRRLPLHVDAVRSAASCCRGSSSSAGRCRCGTFASPA
jgi:hypothetical protein